MIVPLQKTTQDQGVNKTRRRFCASPKMIDTLAIEIDIMEPLYYWSEFLDIQACLYEKFVILVHLRRVPKVEKGTKQLSAIFFILFYFIELFHTFGPVSYFNNYFPFQKKKLVWEEGVWDEEGTKSRNDNVSLAVVETFSVYDNTSSSHCYFFFCLTYFPPAPFNNRRKCCFCVCGALHRFTQATHSLSLFCSFHFFMA